MTLEELTKQFTALKADTETKLETQKKEFELKLDAAKRDGEQWKSVAETNAAEAKKFAAEAKKAEDERKATVAATKKVEMVAFIETAVKEGRLSPAMRDIAVKFAETLNTENEVAKFEQKDGSSIAHTQFSLFKMFVSMVGKAKTFAMRETTPRAEGGKTLPEETESAEVKEFTNVIYGGVKKLLPLQNVDLGVRAIEYQDTQAKLGRKVDYADALIHVSRIMKQEAAA